VDSTNPVRLQSDCCVRTAREHHAALLSAFRGRDYIEIDAAGVEHVDLTLIQLLVSATKTAKTSRKRMRLIAASEPLRSALARAGLRLSSSEDQITWARG
jgi:anti-anti-sigma regulatory factor